MASFDTNRSYATAHFANRMGAVLLNTIHAFAEWNDARQTRKSLDALTDRELDDIGLVRGDIDLVARR